MRFDLAEGMAVVMALGIVLAFVFTAAWVVVELAFSRRYRWTLLPWLAFAALFAFSPEIQRVLINLFIH